MKHDKLKFKNFNFYWCLLAFAVAGLLLGFLGRWFWFFDLFSHFRIQYLIILIILGSAVFVFAVFKKWIKLLIVGCFLLIMVLSLANYFPFGVTPRSGQRVISILYANVGILNEQDSKVVNLLEDVKPDVFVISELNPRWYRVLVPYLQDYQQRAVHIREDNFGLGVYGRILLKGLQSRYFGGAQIPSITFFVEGQEQDVAVWATHPVPPISERYWRWRNDHLISLSREFEKEQRPIVVVGDLNTTPWSYWYHIISRHDLRDGALHRGFHPTWPSFWPAFFGIPIDHVLVSDAVSVIERKVLHYTGSDHYPLFIRLGI